MLNEIIKTAEELNTAALYYRQSGNMDGVRELAKAHAVSKKQTEEFIQGSRYRLVDIPIEERKFANASEKLRAEMFALKDAGFADIIGQYLVNLAKTDSALDAQVLKKHKMLQRCLDYVTQKAYNIALEGAKKKGENGIRANTGLALSGDQVFPWVLEYYAKDDEKEIAEKEQEEKKAKEAEEGQLPEECRALIAEGQRYVAHIRECNDAIPGEEISAKISRMEMLVDRIFDRVEENPQSVSDIRKLMEYYLPTTIKLLEAYEQLDRQPVDGENIQTAKREIEATLDTLNTAFEKLLDDLFQDTMWDVSSDISVLNTMLAQEGLKEDGMKK